MNVPDNVLELWAKVNELEKRIINLEKDLSLANDLLEKAYGEIDDINDSLEK